MQCAVCKYKNMCKSRAEEPLLSGCSSGHPMEFINRNEWVLCPICGGKTRTKIRPDTEAKNLPILCRLCKNEIVADIKDMRVIRYDKSN